MKDVMRFLLAKLDDVHFTLAGLLSRVASLFNAKSTHDDVCQDENPLLAARHQRVKLDDPLVGDDHEWWEQWYW